MALSEIVPVTIQAGTVNPARRGFGVPLILPFHSKWSGTEVRTYTSFAGVATDFPETHSMPYKLAAAMFSQSPRPTKIKIGRLPTPPSDHLLVLDFTDHPTATDVKLSVVEHDGTATALSVAWNTDLATTLAAVDTALEALGGISVATASPLLTVTTSTNGEQTHITPTAGSATVCYVRETTADWDYDDALAAHAAVDGDFFGIVIDSGSPKNMDKVARWALANDRFAFFGPQYTKPAQFVTGEFSAGADFTALQANDSAAGLFTKASRNSAPEAAWVGLMFPLDPGSATYAFKRLSGVGADAWTSTERTTIETTNKGNHYAAEATIGITRPGKCFGGEWIDVTIGLAWLQARLEERLFSLLVNNPKIPYTDEGIALIVAEVAAQLQEAEDRDVLAPGWTVTAGLAADAEVADKADRILRDVSFAAVLAGAIHTINIVGTVTA
jgi:hypothetical protein